MKRFTRKKTKRNQRGASRKKPRSQRGKELFDKDFEIAVLEQKLKNHEEIRDLIERFKRNPDSPRYDIYEERKTINDKQIKDIEKELKKLLKGYNYRVDRIKTM
jgi:hypothetical protein